MAAMASPLSMLHSIGVGSNDAGGRGHRWGFFLSLLVRQLGRLDQGLFSGGEGTYRQEG